MIWMQRLSGGDFLKFAIVTGTSRGLGASIAMFLLELGINVYGISRTKNEKIQQVAKENNAFYEHLSCNLADLDATKEVIETIKKDLQQKEVTDVYIVNNAAVIAPIDQASKTTGEDLATHFQVNMIAPMM